MERYAPDFHDYDWIVVNSSAGKDSTVTLLTIMREAERQDYSLARIVVVHSDLGRVEWDGCPELAQEHADHFGLRFEVVRHARMDLLARIEEKGQFPDYARRWCTSDFKRGPIQTLFTRLANELHGNKRDSKRNPSRIGRAVRILNCMGMRAEESPMREKMAAFEHDAKATNGRRHVDRWLPVHHWNTDQVWACIKRSGLRWHKAYDLGMPRLSCCFCIYANRENLLLAGEHNRELLDEYVRVEEKIGHTFTKDLPIVEIRDALDNGERADPESCRACPWAA